MLGKSAFNMKQSTLKQLMKSSKDGLPLTIQCQPSINLSSPASVAAQRHHHTGLGAIAKHHMDGFAKLDHNPLELHNGGRLSSEFVQSPETPKSTISEASMGYHSLSHSMPSEVTNGITVTGMMELTGPDSTTGQHGLNREQSQTLSVGEREKKDVLNVLSENSCVSNMNGHQLKFNTPRDTLPGGSNKSNYQNRPANLYSPRRHTTSHPSRSGDGE